MARNCVGLDIGSSSIKVVAVKASKRGVALQAFGIEPLPPQTIVDGTIMNQSACVEAIRSLWSRLRLRRSLHGSRRSGMGLVRRLGGARRQEREHERQQRCALIQGS